MELGRAKKEDFSNRYFLKTLSKCSPIDQKGQKTQRYVILIISEWENKRNTKRN